MESYSRSQVSELILAAVEDETAALRRQVEELRRVLDTIAGTLDAIAETMDGKPYHIIKAAIRSQAKQARAALARWGAGAEQEETK